jgi:hypothetical protein
VAAVVRRILDVGGVVRYVFLLILYLEHTIFVDLYLLFGRSLIINRCTRIRVDRHNSCFEAVWSIIIVAPSYIDGTNVTIVVAVNWVVAFDSDDTATPRVFYRLL